MLFTEPFFLFIFLPAVLLANALVPAGLRNLVLLAASLFFYAMGEKGYTVIMLASMGWNFGVAAALGRTEGTGARKRVLALGIAGNLGLLIYFKYANFLVDNANPVLHAALGATIRLGHVHLPVGISFFTFHSLSYLIDVYRRRVDASRSPVVIALYITLFPQLIAGPIIRYKDIAQQFLHRTVTRASFAEGCRRFVIGLGKKMIIANAMAAPADRIFALPSGERWWALSWIGVLCYSLQIYFDFSGYSDMAIGLARMLGFRFRENFRWPYTAATITEFWRRWHISLSTWFRDYLYIPLGGNRAGAARTYFNLMTVFVLCGFWHGANWTFLAWGMIHGAFLVLERSVLGGPLERSPAMVRHVYTLLVVVIAWVFFRAENIHDAVSYLGTMFGVGGPTGEEGRASPWLFIDREAVAIGCIGIIGSTPILPAANRWLARRLATRGGGPGSARPALGMAMGLIHTAAIAVIAVYSAMLSIMGTYNPFIYFRF